MKQYENLKHGTEEFPVGIHDTVCENGFSLYPHIHREFEFLVMTEGCGTVYIEEEKFYLSQGEGVFINSGELHIGIKTDSGKASFFAVVFSPEILGVSFSDMIMQRYIMPVYEGEIRFKRRLDEDVLALLEKIHRHRESELLIKGCLFEIWDLCIKSSERVKPVQTSKNSEDIKRAMAYIRNHFEEDITLDELAEYAGMSKSYFCRRFSAFVHMTPFKYINEVRLDKSCDLLKESDAAVGEIAIKCGFNSFSYYSKLFAEKMGCTPREYRIK